MPKFLTFDNKEVDPQVGFQSTNQNTKSVSKLSRKAKIICIIPFVLVVIIGAVLLWYFLAKKNDSSSLYPQFKEMEGDMNQMVDPCNDFYEYSCGKYIDRHLPFRSTRGNVYVDKFAELQKQNNEKMKEVLENMSQTSDPVFKKAYTYYKSCMTGRRSMDIYFKAAEAIGGSDMTTAGTFDHSSWNLESALKQLKLRYNANPLFNVQIATKLRNKSSEDSRNILTIYPPDYTILSKLATADEMERNPGRGHNFDIIEEDLEHISSFNALYEDKVKYKFLKDVGTRVSKFYLSRYVNEAISFERKLMLKLLSGVSRLEKLYKIVTVSQLETITNNTINWSTLLQSLFATSPSFKITSDTQVGLMVPTAYLQQVSDYIRYEKRKLPNFFAWFLLKKMSPVLPDAYFAAYYFNSDASEIGTKGKEKWRACMIDTEANLPFSTGMMFTKAVTSNETAKKTETMLQEIKTSFEKGSANLKWLDQATKDAVHSKIQYVIDKISNPNLFKADWLNSVYKTVAAQENDLARFFVSCQENLVRMNLIKINEKFSRSTLDVSTLPVPLYTVNAFYNPAMNAIYILSGILRPPFFYSNGPTYLTFAKIGSVLGHELLHGFDSNGRYFDKEGWIAPWWSQESAKEFDIRANCVKSQYNQYISGTKHVNGTATLAENIADNAGLKYAFHAYKHWAKNHSMEKKPPKLKSLSYDQLFFIGYAQIWCRAASISVKDFLKGSHSPSRYRVIGSVSNFPEFAKAFSCSLGKQMNPVKKCEFW